MPASNSSCRVTTPCAARAISAIFSSTVLDWASIWSPKQDGSEVRPRGYSRGVATLRDPWTLGGHRLPNRVVLAPLAGIGNWFVRLQAKRYGAGLAISEMVSSFGLKYGDDRTHREFLRIHPVE